MSHLPPRFQRPPVPWVRIILPVLFFFSGSAALMYEVVWTHQFANILGSTTESMALVFAAFLALLATGGYVCGRSLRMTETPFRSYAILEAGIAVTGVGSALILLRFELSIVDLLPRPDNPILRILGSLAVVVLMIGPATFLMGGTLPLMTEAVKRWYLPSRQITVLYGLNTAGAALGALLPGVLLIPALGLSGTAVVAMLLNVLVGLMVLVAGLARSDNSQAASTGPNDTNGRPGTEGLSPTVFGLLAFGSGFNVLLMEMGWGRLARLVVGNRTLAVSVLLFNILLWLGAASLVQRGLVRFARVRLGLLSRQYLMLLLCGTALLQLVCTAAAIQLAGTFEIDYWSRVLLFLAAMGLPFFAAGLLFPWLLAHFPHVDAQTGSSVGFLYATNVAGSILGALLTTFVLIEAMGTASALLLGSGLLLALGLAVGFPRHGGRTISGGVGAALVAVWLAGAVAAYPRRLVPVPPGQQLIDYRDDRYGIQVLTVDPKGVVTALNNNVRLVARLGEPNTTYAQHLQADIPMLLAEHTDHLFNIGTGFGITAGAFSLWKGRYQDMVSVEILPFMVDNQHRFQRDNYAFYDQPGNRLVLDDGRHLLLSSGQAYDILSVNPIDPRLPGSSSLSTVDFWRRARAQLQPGGVYTQLVWGPQTKLLVQAFAEVFPRFMMFRAYTGSYVLAGFNSEGEIPAFRLERLTPEVREAYRRFGIEDLDTFLTVLREVAEQDTKSWRELVTREPEPVLHSTDLPILEFSRRYAPAFRVPDEEW